MGVEEADCRLSSLHVIKLIRIERIECGEQEERGEEWIHT
jgi:hypothetical protein